ncbi:hypothetical protein [Gorillibacterium sp. sgz5001074]|uniref:hypothetical protein n=1 Tax=Gorillibacterium sp. sgz5001074 TaxID=3446695 RepID=UPI003F668A9D
MSTWKQSRLLSALLAVILLLPGCMYGDRIKKQGAPASGEYLTLVQSAMEQYRTKTGVLPIHNKEAVRTEYERYLIDFKKLQDARLLTTVPTNAFENGGTAMYVVARTESTPVVKLLDLVTYQAIAELQRQVDSYKSGHNGAVPKGEAVSDGYWLPDYKLLSLKEPELRSPYSPANLHAVMNGAGTVGIDYGPEILKQVQKKGLKPDPQADLRDLLLDDGHFVPAVSFPTRWSGQAPVLAP